MWRHVCRSLSPLLSWLKFDMYCLCYHVNLWKSVSDLQSIAHTRSQSYSNTAGTWLSVRWSGREREAGRGSGREIESDREWMKVSLCVCLDMWVSVWVNVCARGVCLFIHPDSHAPETPTRVIHDICLHFVSSSHLLLISHLLPQPLFCFHHRHP